jgi:uncharacterized membrane protein YgcG
MFIKSNRIPDKTLKITMKKIIILAALLATMVSCSRTQQKQPAVPDGKIHCYQRTMQGEDGHDMVMWYYVIYLNNGNVSYIASPTEINSFTGTSWTTSNEIPADFNMAEVQEVGLVEIPDQIEVDMADQVTEANNNAEVAESSTESSNTDASNTDASSDAGSGDSGSGGDGGGGDGGGGGGE